ncbi:MAG: 6-phosphofructokinase [Ardenticatenaceae bacterium]|nr:6-phosphofructokinase [Ardenticatenaceae bacterium]
MRRIGVLTGGGDAPGLNAVIRAVVKSAINVYGWEVYGIHDGFEGLIREGAEGVSPLDLRAVRGILPRGGTILGTVNYSTTGLLQRDPVTGRSIVTEWAKETARARLAELQIDALVIIGGDGTMTMGEQFYRAGVNLVGVPKTIDNDLPATEYTFGFDTAVDTATDAIDKLHTTAESHHRVMVLEVMGRNAGWIALYAGVAGGADVILIPELPFTVEAMCRKIARRRALGRRFSIIVVAEGAVPVGGAQFYEATSSGQERLGGIGEWVAAEISLRCNVQSRTVVLGHLQRGGSPSAFDRVLATRFGAEAVHLLADGRFGQVVTLECGQIIAVPLEAVTGRQRTVPPESSLIRTAQDLGISFGNEASRSTGEGVVTGEEA